MALVGIGGVPLIGEWMWKLTQSRREKRHLFNAVLAQDDDTGGLNKYPDGRIGIVFTQDPNRNDAYDFHLEGRLLGTDSTIPDDSIDKQIPVRTIIRFTVPNELMDRKRSSGVTVTVPAKADSYKVTTDNGKEATDKYKVHVAVKGEGGFKLLTKISGDVDREKNWGDVTTSSQRQEWTFYHYTAGFEVDKIKVD